MKSSLLGSAEGPGSDAVGSRTVSRCSRMSGSVVAACIVFGVFAARVYHGGLQADAAVLEGASLPALPVGVSAAFLKSLPKTELHLHLEGTLEPDMAFDLAQKYHMLPLMFQRLLVGRRRSTHLPS